MGFRASESIVAGEQAPREGEAQAYGSAAGPVVTAEAYEVEGMTLSRRHWNRLKEEAEEAKMGWTELWLGAAFAFFGIAAAAAIARIAVPSDGGPNETHLSHEAMHLLVYGAIVALIGGALCFLAWLGRRRDHNAEIDQLIKNMASHEHFPPKADAES
jgi:hypothetical protein